MIRKDQREVSGDTLTALPTEDLSTRKGAKTAHSTVTLANYFFFLLQRGCTTLKNRLVPYKVDCNSFSILSSAYKTTKAFKYRTKRIGVYEQ